MPATDLDGVDGFPAMYATVHTSSSSENYGSIPLFYISFYKVNFPRVAILQPKRVHWVVENNSEEGQITNGSADATLQSDVLQEEDSLRQL